MKWISIEEKIPDDGQKCLITDGDTVVSARWFSGESGIWCSCGFGGHEWEWDYEPEQSTHWMPLPEPPRAGVVENFAHEPTKELQTEALNKHNVSGQLAITNICKCRKPWGVSGRCVVCEKPIG